MVKLSVNRISVGDPADPDIYFYNAMDRFFLTEKGNWIKQHSKNITVNQYHDAETFSIVYNVVAEFDDDDYFIYKLKWS
jgi:hypothetical protein